MNGRKFMEPTKEQMIDFLNSIGGKSATKKRLGEFSCYEMREFIESEPYIKEKFEKELKRQEEEAHIDGPTRKQMVDFLYSCNIYENGKRVTKKSLNAQSYGVLSEMINSSDKVKKAFEESISNPQMKKKEKRVSYVTELSEEKTRELEKLVDEFINNPFDFTVCTKLMNFLHMLPFGSVAQGKLDELADKVAFDGTNEGVSDAVRLYAIDQMIKMEKIESKPLKKDK